MGFQQRVGSVTNLCDKPLMFIYSPHTLDKGLGNKRGLRQRLVTGGGGGGEGVRDKGGIGPTPKWNGIIIEYS